MRILGPVKGATPRFAEASFEIQHNENNEVPGTKGALGVLWDRH